MTPYNRRANQPKAHPHLHLYNDSRWAKMRSRTLRAKPLCAVCGKLAADVDHIQPHRGDPKLFFDLGNIQPICKPCHKSKTRRERKRI